MEILLDSLQLFYMNLCNCVVQKTPVGIYVCTVHSREDVSW